MVAGEGVTSDYPSLWIMGEGGQKNVFDPHTHFFDKYLRKGMEAKKYIFQLCKGIINGVLWNQSAFFSACGNLFFLFNLT